MHPSATPHMGPAGPYHQPMPPQMPYHGDQVPTTSHPSWHHPAYSGLPTPPYHQFPAQQHPQQSQLPNYPPMTPHPSQQHHQQHPQMTPQALTQQQQVQQQQQRSAYSSPSPSLGPTAPAQNQKVRTEQWLQPFPYAQSPGPSVAPSVMSYHQNDDRMSMLSVNTSITNQYPETQRCFSSNGSTCENVNPEMAQANWAPGAEQAMREWFNTPDLHRKLNMAATIRAWVKADKFSNVDPSFLREYIQRILNIIYDGMKIPRSQTHPTFFAQIHYYLLDTLLRITYYRNTLPHMDLVIQMFIPRENSAPEFRFLFCDLLRLGYQQDEHLRHCTNQAFQILEHIIQYLNNPKHEKMRMEFARAIKFPGLFDALLEYFVSPVPPLLIHPAIMMILRFVISKDAPLKDNLIWRGDSGREKVPSGSILLLLISILVRSNQEIDRFAPDPEKKNPESTRLTYLVTRTFDLLNLLMHDPNSIDGFVKAEGVNFICLVVSQRGTDVVRSGFKLLLHVSDAKALSLIDLTKILPFILNRVRQSLRNKELRKNEEDDVVYCGTGFLSNVVAHKQHVKELAIEHDAFGLLYEVMLRYIPLQDLKETLRRNLVCGTICNCIRTLNNFLMTWIPMQNGQTTEATSIVQHQVCRFIEIDILKKLMVCLSIEEVDTFQMMELRSTIVRLFLLLLRTPFIPKDGLLNVIDDMRKKNLVAHICSTFSWAMAQPTNDKTRSTKKTLIERVFNLLVRLIEQCGAANEVALSFYGVNCPLSLLNCNDIKPPFVLNVLIVCDQILKHNPSVANVWSVDRPMLEVLKNHSNSDIERAASSLLSKLPDTDPLAVILSNC